MCSLGQHHLVSAENMSKAFTGECQKLLTQAWMENPKRTLKESHTGTFYIYYKEQKLWICNRNLTVKPLQPNKDQNKREGHTHSSPGKVSTSVCEDTYFSDCPQCPSPDCFKQHK